MTKIFGNRLLIIIFICFVEEHPRNPNFKNRLLLFLVLLKCVSIYLLTEILNSIDCLFYISKLCDKNIQGESGLNEGNFKCLDL